MEDTLAQKNAYLALHDRGRELSIREVARRVERDVKAVHTDLQALLACGIVDKGTAGVIFPYDQNPFSILSLARQPKKLLTNLHRLPHVGALHVN
ncbi:Predicted transcriptional regulator [Serratia fonticola]|uniref:Predicted transcriptional regulator n=1 Tax=Serratia fonticola TaxID=47917 RepID=A0A4U9WLI3_SERFO|nr:Predicted transcriptional regulator [Serratia fonticola]